MIEICGGIPAVARMTDRSEVRVRRWTYPRERGGTGGLIPAECQVRLLQVAFADGIDLAPHHFFPPDLVAAIAERPVRQGEGNPRAIQGNEVADG